MSDRSPSRPPALAVEARGLQRRYGDTVALAGVDVAIPAGGVLGLLGPNGAGKTTTVKILTTQERPDAGTASVLGHNVVADAAAVRRRIGLAGQYAAVDPKLTGRENLVMIGRLSRLPRRIAARRANELLRRFGLADAADRPVEGYSGGMRRRVDLAAALVHAPPVLFLDEPTTGLDPRSRAQMWEVIGELVDDGTTLLLTTQYLEEADVLADRVAVIDAGRIIAEGTSAELKSRLGAELIVLDLDSGAVDAAGTRTVSTALEELRGVQRTEADGTTITIAVTSAGQALLPVAREVERLGAIIVGVDVRRPSLDDVFLTLTETPADEDDADRPVPVAAS